MSSTAEIQARLIESDPDERTFRATNLARIYRQIITRLPGAMALADQAVVSVTNFGVGVAIGRVCGKTELGMYSLALTLTAAADTLSSSLVSTPYMVRHPQLPAASRRTLLGTALVHHVTLTFAIALLLGLGVLFLGGHVSQPGVSRPLSIAACALLFVNTREFLRRVSFARLEVHSAFFIDLVSCLIQAAGLLLLFGTGCLNAGNVFLVTGSAGAAASACWLLRHRKTYRLDPGEWLVELRRTWDFAKWLCLSTVLWNSGGYLYPWLLTAFHGAAAAGTWAACSAIASLGNPVMLGLGNYVAPKIAHVRASQGLVAMKRYVQKSSVAFAGLLLPVVLVFGICGSQLVARIYGHGYKDTSTVLSLLAFNVLVTAFSFSYSRGLYCLECAKADGLINIAALGSALTIGVVAVHAFSAAGAAMASLASATATAGIRVAILNRQVKLQYCQKR